MNQLKPISPIKRGIITNQEYMELLWQHSFDNIMHIKENEFPSVFMEEGPLISKSNRQFMAEIMYSKFNIPSLYISTQGVLALYAVGCTSGVVYELGEGQSHLTCVHQGHVLPESIYRYELGGLDINDYLITSLEINHGLYMNTDMKAIPYDIKETCCYLASDYDSELTLANDYQVIEQDYKLPDNQTILTLNTERIQAPEVLFQPLLLHKHEMEGIHRNLYRSITQCPIHVRRDLCRNIVVSGGTTLLSGFPERLLKEIQALFPSSLKNDIHITSIPERQYSQWIGGAILSSLSSFQSHWISKSEYDECGSSCLFRDVH